MSSKAIQRAVKRGARLAKIKHWQAVTPKSLRDVFQNIARAQFADGNGRMDEKDQLFLMGHIENGFDDAYFDGSKVEYLRSEYQKLRFTDEPEHLTAEDKEKLLKYKEMMQNLQKQNSEKVDGLQEIVQR